MKKLRTLIFSLIFASFFLSFFTVAFTEETKSFHNNYGAVTLPSLEATGLLKLNGTTIQEALRLTGSLIASDATLGSLAITGEANLSHTTIAKASTVFGSLQASHSTFLQPLTLQTQKAIFTASKVESITVQSNVGFKGKQIIELRQGTEVSGPITFESGRGEVYLYPGAHLYGPVHGGHSIKKR